MTDPGLEGAGIIANTLFGKGEDANRFGRMPYTTYPASFVYETPMMEHDLSAPPGRTHKHALPTQCFYRSRLATRLRQRFVRRYYTGTPVVPFGHGLSYSRWSMQASGAAMAIATDGSKDTAVSIAVTNHGPLVGDCVVLAFLVPKHLPTQKGLKLRQQLWQFERLSEVAVGETAHAEFLVSAEALAIADLGSGDLVAAPGTYALDFRDGSASEPTSIELTVQGPQVVIEPFPSA